MEQFINSLVAAGVDRERIEKARHRGVAYQCVRCLQKNGTGTINIKCRMEDHVMRKHMVEDEIPFRCTLCGFMCLKREQIFHHIENYTRHITVAAKKKVTNHFPYLVESQRPHVFGPEDFKSLSPLESLLHFLGVVDDGSALPVTSTVVPINLTTPSAFRPIPPSTAEATMGPSRTPQVVVSSPLPTGREPPSLSTPTPAMNDTLQQEGTPLISEQPELVRQLNAILQSIAGIVQEPQGAGKPADLGAVQEPMGVEQPRGLSIRAPEKTVECALEYEGGCADFAANQDRGLSVPVCENVPVEEQVTYPVYVPTPIDSSNPGNETESPIPREGDILDLADDNMSIATPTKRTRETQDEGQESKKPRGESLPVDTRECSERALVDMVGKALNEMERSREVQERMMKAIIDSSCVQSKLVDAVGRLRGAVEDLNRDNRRREERRRAFEDRWEDEWRKEWNRRRDEDRRAEARRRESDRVEREERRKREDKEEEEAEKENANRPKSTLGRVYTKNTVSEGSKKTSRH